MLSNVPSHFSLTIFTIPIASFLPSARFFEAHIVCAGTFTRSPRFAAQFEFLLLAPFSLFAPMSLSLLQQRTLFLIWRYLSYVYITSNYWPDFTIFNFSATSPFTSCSPFPTQLSFSIFSIYMQTTTTSFPAQRSKTQFLRADSRLCLQDLADTGWK